MGAAFFVWLLVQMAIVLNHTTFKCGLTPETGILGRAHNISFGCKVNGGCDKHFLHIAAKHSQETRPFPVPAMPLWRKGPETKRRRKEATVTSLIPPFLLWWLIASSHSIYIHKTAKEAQSHPQILSFDPNSQDRPASIMTLPARAEGVNGSEKHQWRTKRRNRSKST